MPNGLNQLAVRDGAALTYDARGNLLAAPGADYMYTADNRLTARQEATKLCDYLAETPIGSQQRGSEDENILLGDLRLLGGDYATGSILRHPLQRRPCDARIRVPG